MAGSNNSEKPLHWLVRPSTIRLLIAVSTVALLALAIYGFIIDSHPHFEIDAFPFFYSWYGFLTCVAMVIFAKLLGIFLKRRDSYYDD